MHKTLILALFIALTKFAYCDTLDYYHVYLNDSLIGQFNSLSEKPSLVLKSSELNNSDVLTVRYGTDHPCAECVYVVTVLMEVQEKTQEAETKENFGKMSIPIRDLRYFQREYKMDSFHFNYYQKTKESRYENGTYLFELKIVKKLKEAKTE